VGSRAGLDEEENRKISCPYRESNLGRPARSLVTILTEYLLAEQVHYEIVV